MLVWTMSSTPTRHNHEQPMDALLTAIDYLRRGRNVRLNAATVQALDQSTVGDVAEAARLANMLTR